MKSDGGIGICENDILTVNPVLEDHRHPIPLIEEIFASLEGGEEYTKLDLKWAYNQIELDKETSKLLTLSSHLGAFRVLRMFFGPKPAYAAFQEEIDVLVIDIDGVRNYFDDLIITVLQIKIEQST